MDKSTFTALKKSIDKWDLILSGKGTDEGIENCALCKKFLEDYCYGCPVKQNTGHTGCIHSPYERWADHFKEVHPTLKGDPRLVRGCKTCKELAYNEYAFLTSLLPVDYPHE